MRGFTGLPTSAYLKVSEEALIQLSDLQTLVPQLEAGWSPAYLARYRPDVAAGLNEGRIAKLLAALQEQSDLGERKITVLTAVGQRDQLTPELRERIEAVTDRRELEDIYLPYKKKLRAPADDALDQGLEELARFIWHQEPADADVLAEAQKRVSPESGVASAPTALAGARHIVARWLAENSEIRKDLRKLFRERTILRVRYLKKPGDDPQTQKRYSALDGYQGLLNKMPWRQMLILRRGIREERLTYEMLPPESRAVSYLLGRLVRDRKSMFCLQLGACSCLAYHSYLGAPLADEVWQDANDRCDEEAIRSFQKTLKRILMSPPAGAVPIVGLETGRSERWLATVIDADGRFVEGGVVRGEKPDTKPEESAEGGEDSAVQAEAAAKEAEAAAPPEQAEAKAEAKAEETEAAPSQEAEVKEEVSDAASEAPVEAKVEEPVVSEAPEPVEVKEEAAEAAPPPAVADPVEEVAEAPAPPEAEAGPKPEAAAEVEAATEAGPPDSAEPEVPAKQAEEPPARAARKSGSNGARAEKRAPAASRNTTAVVDLKDLLDRFAPRFIALSNGPGVRQVERFIRSKLRDSDECNAVWTTVNESGSWIYANSKTAKKELPNVEPGVRSAVTLARRLQDPLQELVKIDPKILPIGQGHHEVDQRRLRTALRETIEECVHEVGADLNRAPAALLALVPGLTERVARRIVEYREKKSAFASRRQLREVPGMNDRMYEQAVGFCRVAVSENPLDRTGIHPRLYPVIEKVLAEANAKAAEALEKPEALDAIDLEKFASKDTPAIQLKHALRELKKEVREPRGEFAPPTPPVELRAAAELQIGMKVEGVVTNIAAFGAFVDIGADQDGLVHVSQLSETFVKDPKSAVSVGQKVTVYILALEDGGRRISLSMREKRESARQRRTSPEARQPMRGGGEGRPSDDRRRSRPPGRESQRPQDRTFGPDEKTKARKAKEEKSLSLEEKLNLLQSRFRTKT